MRDTIFALAALIFFVSWLIGVVGSLRFSQYVRRTHPSIAKEHFPGILHGSIAQQLRTQRWMKTRGYSKVGDEELTHRADRHSKISGVVSKTMMCAMVVLVLSRIFFAETK
jgi:hypothetical protein